MAGFGRRVQDARPLPPLADTASRQPRRVDNAPGATPPRPAVAPPVSILETRPRPVGGPKSLGYVRRRPDAETGSGRLKTGCAVGQNTPEPGHHTPWHKWPTTRLCGFQIGS